jgi:hypothetical protein
MESAKNRMLVLVAFDELSNFGTGYSRFDEYDVSLVQEQKAALRACPARKIDREVSVSLSESLPQEVELLCLSLVGTSSCGLNSVVILTH